MNTNYLFQLGGGKTPRQSNMEALRIVAMSMILIHHFLLFSFKTEPFTDKLFNVVNPFFYCGVNIFFLISGYFGIKLKLQKVIRFVLIILVFNLINIIAELAVGIHISVFGIIPNFIWPISNSPYWFIKVYFLLMLSAPIINSALDSMDHRKLGLTILAFTIALIWMKGNLGNHSYLNAAFMYCIGGYISRYDIATRLSKKMLAIMFFSICIVWGIASTKLPAVLGAPFLDYDNFFVVSATLSISLLFTKFHFNSNLVNRIAACALGCYLLQDGRFGKSYFYELQGRFIDSHSIAATIVMFIVCFVGFWLVSYLITTFINVWVGRLSAKLASFVKRVIPAKLLT